MRRVTLLYLGIISLVLITFVVMPVLFMRTKETFMMMMPPPPPSPLPFMMSGMMPPPDEVAFGDIGVSGINVDVKIDNSGIGSGNGGGNGGSGDGVETATAPFLDMDTIPPPMPTPHDTTYSTQALVGGGGGFGEHNSETNNAGALAFWHPVPAPAVEFAPDDEQLPMLYRELGQPPRNDAFGRPLDKCLPDNNKYLCHAGERIFGRTRDNAAKLCEYEAAHDIPDDAGEYISCESAQAVDKDGFIKSKAGAPKDDAACKAYLESGTWPFGTKLNTHRPDSLWMAMYHGQETEGFPIKETPCKGLPWKSEYQDIIDKGVVNLGLFMDGNVVECDKQLMNDEHYGTSNSEREIGYDLRYKWPNSGVIELDRLATDIRQCRIHYDKAFDNLGCRKEIKRFAWNNKDADWMAYDYPMGQNWATNIKNGPLANCKPFTFDQRYQGVFEGEYRDANAVRGSVEEARAACIDSVVKYIEADFPRTALDKFKMFKDEAATMATLEKNNVAGHIKDKCAHLRYSGRQIQEAVDKTFIALCSRQQGIKGCDAILGYLEQERGGR